MMRCYLAPPISLWFVLITQGSATTDRDICSGVIDDFNMGSGIVKFVVENTITVPTNCLCEITTNSPAISLCPLAASATCSSGYYCTPDECLGSDVSLDSDQTCIFMYVKRICSRESNQIDTCLSSTNFTIDLSITLWTECSRKNNGFQIILQASGSNKPTFREAMCTARSLTSDTPRETVTPTTLNSWTTQDAAAAATAATKRNKMIGGIVVGVVGGVSLSATIIIVNVVCRRRQGKPIKPPAKKLSETRASVPTAYESYTDPVSVAYENSAIGSSLHYQSLDVFDNEAVGESNDGYTEANEAEGTGNDNGYDNYSINGGNEVNSMRNANMGKKYDSVSDSPSSNIEDETTVIDNEFYG